MLVIVALVLGIFISYTFIGFQTNKYNYSADFSFIMFKFKILLGTIALGYFTAILSNFYDSFPIEMCGKIINAIMNVVAIDWIRALIAFISSIWVIFALAMLPYNHTVFNVEDNSIDVDRTNQLKQMHQLVYGTPFYVLFIIFSINLFFFIMALCVRNDEMKEWINDTNSTWKQYPPFPRLIENWQKVRPSFGFHFYVGEPGAWGDLFAFKGFPSLPVVCKVKGTE